MCGGVCRAGAGSGGWQEAGTQTPQNHGGGDHGWLPIPESFCWAPAGGAGKLTLLVTLWGLRGS